MALRHPVQLTIDERYLTDNLSRLWRRTRSEYLSFAFRHSRHGSGTGESRPSELIDIRVARYREELAAARAYLALDVPRIRRIETVNGRLQAWLQDLKYFPPDRLKVVLVEWDRRARVEAFYEGRIDIAEAFVTYGLGISGIGGADLIRDRVRPRASRHVLIQLAIDIQSEKDFDNLFYEYLPRIALVAAALIPMGQVGVGLALVFDAILGFLEFMYAMHDAEEDDIITPEEAKEAWWNLIGILPFGIIQAALLAKDLAALSVWVLSELLDALETFWDTVATMIAARAEGWDQGLPLDPSGVVYVPDNCT